MPVFDKQNLIDTPSPPFLDCSKIRFSKGIVCLNSPSKEYNISLYPNLNRIAAAGTFSLMKKNSENRPPGLEN